MASAALLTACGKSDREVRHYKEIQFADKSALPSAHPVTTPAASGAMGDLPPEMQTPSLSLTWDTPKGWGEAKGSGMRIATFMIEGQECSILSFPGDVGGDEKNVERWLGQLGVNVAHDVLHEFTVNPKVITTAGGFECRLFDFAELVPSNLTRNTLAAIIPVGDQTVFVKLMGNDTVLKNEKAAFESLCKSIGLKAE